MRRRQKKTAAPATQVPWRDSFRVYFAQAGETFTPPAAVRLIRTSTGFSVSGPFRLASGVQARLTTRVVVKNGAVAHIASQSLKISCRLAGGAKS